MRIAVTGATGPFGRAALQHLLDRGVPPADLVAVVRTPAKAADLAARGVDVREADYDRPETLAAAFAGVDRLLFVSGNAVGQRVRQHRNVVDAAVGAGVGFVVYTSIPKADTTAMRLAAEHRATEEAIRASGVPFAFLRNAWYLDLYVDTLPRTLAHGLAGSAGDGRISGALRDEYAEAAATVVREGPEAHAGAVYEFGGDEAFSMPDLAAAVTEATGTPVAYRDLPPDAYAAVLTGAGLPEPAAAIYADADVAISKGDLHVTTGDLHRLLGRPPTTLHDALARAVKS